MGSTPSIGTNPNSRDTSQTARICGVPTAVLLALRLPLLDDFKALRWTREHHEFEHVRIAMLSGVEYDNERALALELGADCYHVKPSNFQGLVRIASCIRQRWFAPTNHQAAA